MMWSIGKPFLISRDAETAGQALRKNQVNFVSSGVVVNPNTELGFRKALIVRDPDGHAIEIEQK